MTFAGKTELLGYPPRRKSTSVRAQFPKGALYRYLFAFHPGFTDLAFNEFGRRHPDIPVARRFPGLLLVSSSMPPAEFFGPFRQAPTIYLHFGFQLKAIRPLTGTFADLRLLRRYAGRGLAGACPRYELHRATFPDDRREPYTEDDIREVFPGRSNAGASASDLFLISRVNGRWRLLAGDSRNGLLAPLRPRGAPALNRAGYKLLEAFAEFRPRFAAGDQALDLGAATGAWSRILAEHGLRVTAVDPARLDRSVLRGGRVRHARMRAEEYLRRYGDNRYDLIVNDMIMDPRDSARLMVKAAPLLKKSGRAIMTLKLRAGDARPVLDRTYRILRKRYRIIRVRQLVANRREVTVYLRVKESR